MMQLRLRWSKIILFLHFAIKGEDNKSYYSHLNQVLDEKPNLTMDDGADLVGLMHGKRIDVLKI